MWRQSGWGAGERQASEPHFYHLEVTSVNQSHLDILVPPGIKETTQRNQQTCPEHPLRAKPSSELVVVKPSPRGCCKEGLGGYVHECKVLLYSNSPFYSAFPPMVRQCLWNICLDAWHIVRAAEDCWPLLLWLFLATYKPLPMRVPPLAPFNFPLYASYRIPLFLKCFSEIEAGKLRESWEKQNKTKTNDYQAV